MNDRERYLATLLFQKPDRVHFDPGVGRKSTLDVWHKQGLPPEVTDARRYVRELLGIEPPSPGERISIGVDFRMMPQFEEKVLERRPAPPGDDPAVPRGPGSLVVQDWKGNICEISDEFDVTYLREAIDFVTRSWIKCPVESREDWEQMKARYVVDHPGRFPADMAERARRLRDRNYPSGLSISGPFWQLREWLGFENLCMLFLDDPDFVREMIGFWQRFVQQVFDRIFQHYVPDYITVNEDMAYKEKPMIGAEMSREFLLPCWRAWAGQLRAIRAICGSLS